MCVLGYVLSDKLHSESSKEDDKLGFLIVWMYGFITVS